MTQVELELVLVLARWASCAIVLPDPRLELASAAGHASRGSRLGLVLANFAAGAVSHTSA